MYVKRDIEKILVEAKESFQVITLYGSRQVGKTTTVDHLFGDEFEFVTLDDNEELDLALTNPRAFLESHPWPIIIDEVQKAVILLDEIKKIVDKQRRLWMKNNEPRRLMFVLTGSNQFDLQEGMSESLAGRTAVINRSGFTQMEKRGITGTFFDVDFEKSLKSSRNILIFTETARKYTRIFFREECLTSAQVNQKEIFITSLTLIHISKKM